MSNLNDKAREAFIMNWSGIGHGLRGRAMDSDKEPKDKNLKRVGGDGKERALKDRSHNPDNPKYKRKTGKTMATDSYGGQALG